MRGTLELNGMKFRAYHGCLPRERAEGGDFLVDFSCSYDFSAACGSDDLADTLNYATVYDIVAAQMAVPSCLLEHVAGRIVGALHEAFPALEHFRVSVAKLNPPVAGSVTESRVTIEV